MLLIDCSPKAQLIAVLFADGLRVHAGGLDRVEHIEFESGVPEDVGYVLRSPTALPVRVKLKN